jgi:hypothetical protein
VNLSWQLITTLELPDSAEQLQEWKEGAKMHGQDIIDKIRRNDENIALAEAANNASKVLKKTKSLKGKKISSKGKVSKKSSSGKSGDDSSTIRSKSTVNSDSTKSSPKKKKLVAKKK